jgi:hypothetical protein
MTPIQRRVFIPIFGVLIAGCAGGEAGEEKATASDDAAVSDPRETLAKFAGTWQVHARNEVGDSLPSHTITATGDTAGWALTFPNRPPIPMRILDASGDLVVTETQPYESVLRPGVRVTVLYFTRIRGDSIHGRLVAMYDVSGANAILRGFTDGVRQR